MNANPDRFAIGDRVLLDDYGPGTVELVRDGVIGVHADIGQLWFRDPKNVCFLGESDYDWEACMCASHSRCPVHGP